MKSFRYLALATLVAFAACSESSDTTDNTAVVGTISGTVTIGGSGASGITVALSSGSTTSTDGSGAYSFANVPAGAYTITISDYPADVTFSSTSKAATISTAGATVTVGFAGTYITTSSISGSVSAGGSGLAGVAVALGGPSGAKSAVTDANGNYQFNGLRAGSYTVTISNYPSDVAFTATTAAVTVGVGEAKQAPFVGVREAAEVSATVVIESVRTNPAGAIVNPSNVIGQIDVTLAIDPGTNNITQVCVQLDGNDVDNGCQTLSSAAPGSDGPLAATILEPIFSINTAAVDGDNNPRYMNTSHTLSARLDLSGAKQANVSTNMTLTFNNPNVINLDIVPSVGPVIGGDGLAWNGGNIVVTGTPVMYSGGTVASMTLCANQNSPTGTPAAGTTVCRTASSSPFTVTLPRTSTSGTNLGGWSTNDARITATSVTSTGGTGPAVLLAANQTFRLDEVAPTFVLALPTSVLNQYLGNAFTFASTASAGPSSSRTVTSLSDDPDLAGAATDMAAGVVVTYHVGSAATYNAGGATEDAKVVAENPAVTDVTTLANTITNTAYILVVQAVDVTGNKTITRLGGGTGTTLGVDLESPIASLASGSTADMSINPATAMTINMSDVYSGFGPTPADVQAIRYTVNAVTGATVTRCIDPINGVVGDGDDVATTVPTNTGVCPFVSQAAGVVSFDALLTNDAYYDVTVKVHDRAGNFSTTTTRSVLLDDVLPGVTVTGITAGSNMATVQGTVTDDLDLGWWDTRLSFSGGPVSTLPFSTPMTVSTFGAPYVITAPPSGSAPLIRGYQDQIPVVAGTFNLTGAGFGTTDVAGNFAAASFSTAATFGGLGIAPAANTVTAAALGSSGVDLCLSGKTTSTWCGATSPTSPSTVTLKFTATTSNNDDNPYTNGVWFYVEDLAGVDYVLGHATSPTLTTGTTTRTWTWTMTISASQVPSNVTAPASGVPASVQIRAMAVEADYDGLHVPFTLVTR